ncbi:MAG: NADH-quinone oxidoreductase subunit C [Desulfovibrionaceae bacterium]|nr:NADH-quinone oxidoreductase subunit C [Desulfovibrionaceae bacterium]MBF0512525.1 NADH-quinone oxidoreductase subunit C [Desulfovibrionaceae bacterium]
MSAIFDDFPVPARQVPGDFAKTGQNLSIFLEPAGIVAAAGYMKDKQYFIEDVTGLDLAEGFCVLYHFAHFEKPGRVTLRLLASRENPTVPSIAGVYGGAQWHERETRDFYGIAFEGNPNDGPLLLAEEEMAPPLLKDEARRAVLQKTWPYEAMGVNPVPAAKPAPAAKPVTPVTPATEVTK